MDQSRESHRRQPPSWLRVNSDHSEDAANASPAEHRTKPASLSWSPQHGSSPDNTYTTDLMFVCTGNICRSAYLHALADQRLTPRGWRIASAGTYALEGAGIDGPMLAELQGRQIQPHQHRARQVSASQLEQTALIVALTRRHWNYLVAESPDSTTRIFTLHALHAATVNLFGSHLTPPSSLAEYVSASYRWVRQHGGMAAFDDVDDPYRQGDNAARHCATECSAVVEPILAVFESLPSPRR